MVPTKIPNLVQDWSGKTIGQLVYHYKKIQELQEEREALANKMADDIVGWCKL